MPNQVLPWNPPSHAEAQQIYVGLVEESPQGIYAEYYGSVPSRGLMVCTMSWRMSLPRKNPWFRKFSRCLKMGLRSLLKYLSTIIIRYSCRTTVPGTRHIENRQRSRPAQVSFALLILAGEKSIVEYTLNSL